MSKKNNTPEIIEAQLPAESIAIIEAQADSEPAELEDGEEMRQAQIAKLEAAIARLQAKRKELVAWGKPERQQSECESPVKRVWAICSEMPDAERKAIIAACLAAGINKNTAQTQYAAWRKANIAA